jgi:hypothetical protein
VAPLPGRWLAEAQWPGCSGAPNAMGKMTKWRGDHGGAHLGQQTARRVVVAAHGGGVAPPGTGDSVGSMWGSSGSKKMTGSFTVTSSSSSRLQLRQTVVNQWRTTAARVWFLQIELWRK